MTTQPLYEIASEPVLSEPVLVLGLDGWVDAGAGGASAIEIVARQATTVVARFEIDRLLDHRARRPILRLVDGVNRGLRWPTIELRSGADDAGHELLLLTGPEPDLAWGGFTANVLELAQRFGVRLVVGLGAFPAPVPHTRPVRLASTATTPELAREIGFVPGALELPAGIHAALEAAFGTAGLPALGLWARVPHYVAAMPYPAASAALIDGLAAVAGLRFNSRALHEAAASTRSRIDELIANSEEHRRLVAQLEGLADQEAAQTAGAFGQDLPSGEEIAAELERFLRGDGAF